MTQSVTVPKLTTGGQKALFYGGASVLTLVAAAPLIAIAAGAAVNLGVIAVTGAFLWGLWMARPALSLWWKNRVLKMLKAEARSNPIETLQNEYLGRKGKFEEARQRLVHLKGTRDSLREKLEAFQEKHGVTDESLQKMFDGLSRLIDQLERNLTLAGQKLEEFRRNMELQADRYKIAMETGALAEELRQASGDNDPMQQFLHNEAIDAIRTEFNRSMAQIDDLLLGDESVQQVQQDDALPMIDVTPIAGQDVLLELEPERVKVKA